MENYITHSDILREDTISWFTDSWFLWKKEVPVKVVSVFPSTREVVITTLDASTLAVSVDELQTFPVISQYVKHNGQYLYVTQNGYRSHKKGLITNKLKYLGVKAIIDLDESPQLVKTDVSGGESKFYSLLRSFHNKQHPVFKSLEHYLHCFDYVKRRIVNDYEQHAARITNDLFIISGILPIRHKDFHVVVLKGKVIGHLDTDKGEVQLSNCSHEIRLKLRGYFQDVKFNTTT